MQRLRIALGAAIAVLAINMLMGLALAQGTPQACRNQPKRRVT